LDAARLGIERARFTETIPNLLYAYLRADFKAKIPTIPVAVPKMEPAARNDLQAPLSHLFRQDY
jgi:hypothetical protein